MRIKNPFLIKLAMLLLRPVVTFCAGIGIRIAIALARASLWIFSGMETGSADHWAELCAGLWRHKGCVFVLHIPDRDDQLEERLAGERRTKFDGRS